MQTKSSPDQTWDGAVEHARSVRSFVIRGGRLTQAQQRALDLLWPRYGIPFEPSRLALEVAFGRARSTRRT